MSREDNNKRWEERGDKAYDKFTAHPGRTIAKWFAGIVVLCVVGGIVFGAISWVGSWGGEAARVTGVENTRDQTTRVLALEEAMITDATTACEVKDSAKGADDPTLLEDPSQAYRNNYRRHEQEYNRRMGNLFEAAVTRHNPLPDTINHLPKRAPTLTERQEEVC